MRVELYGCKGTVYLDMYMQGIYIKSKFLATQPSLLHNNLRRKGRLCLHFEYYTYEKGILIGQQPIYNIHSRTQRYNDP